MSLESWKNKYYPRAAGQAILDGVIASTEHSLNKWTGLRPANLVEHGLVVVEPVKGKTGITDGTETLMLDDSTCALCQLAYKMVEGDEQYVELYCEACPLYASLGMQSCFDNDWSPLTAWRKNHDPEPMIAAISRTVMILS